MNEWRLIMGYSNYYIVVSPIKILMSNIIEYTDSIQSETGKYFAIKNLVNIFRSLPISIACQLQVAFKFKETQLTDYAWSTSIACHLTQSL